MKNNVLLLILDGWGHSVKWEHNAILQASTPTWDSLNHKFPSILLSASGTDVGLPANQVGNSEVGHITIGAGRVVEQSLLRINKALEKNGLIDSKVLTSFAKSNKVHLIGLFSDGGVHSHSNHLFAIIKTLLAANNNVKIFLHLISDGRDTAIGSIENSIKELNDFLYQYPQVIIASIAGRFYAMDRDKNWDRTKDYFDLLTKNNQKKTFSDVLSVVEDAKKNGVTDEFIVPSWCTTSEAKICSQDKVLVCNFRSDRMRQICYMLTNHTKAKYADSSFSVELATLTNYDDSLEARVIFPKISIDNTLSEQLSLHGLNQLKVAETEKYPHLTFFLNGGVEQPYPNEHRLMLNSPDVITYDLKPEMNIAGVTNAVCEGIKSHKYQVMFCNIANADMVGHTGNWDATVSAVKHIDVSLSKILEVATQHNCDIIITADHGNAETMFDAGKHTCHTTSPVPMLYIGKDFKFKESQGKLQDIAPTILSMLNLPIPENMEGTPLLIRK